VQFFSEFIFYKFGLKPEVFERQNESKNMVNESCTFFKERKIQKKRIEGLQA